MNPLFVPPPVPASIGAPPIGGSPADLLAWLQRMDAWGQKLTGRQQWGSLAQATSQRPNIREILKGRPPPDAQPDVIDPWLQANSLSPALAYPDWPWSFDYDVSSGASRATAAFDLDSSNHVTWTADSSGQWHYDHQWDNGPLGVILNDALSVIGDASILDGFALGVIFAATLQMVTEGGSIGDIGASLKHDWDVRQDEISLVMSIYDGDWGSVWDNATAFGSDMTGLIAAFGQPAPDRDGNLTVRSASAPSIEAPAPVASPKDPALTAAILANQAAADAKLQAILHPTAVDAAAPYLAADLAAAEQQVPAAAAAPPQASALNLPLADIVGGAIIAASLAVVAYVRGWF